ncbi:MAG: proteasome subunit beta, partial [Candidatus Methanoplasma sp.]|nr:proteasome subunit beta [Candidatus Methanoplasma sp.]
MSNEEILKTGTTTIGLKIKDGVILASDQRATMGN